VLLNLTSNAIKFSGGREGVGNVSVRAVLAKRSAQQAEVDFVVTDDGIGMNELTLEKLFLPFSQADASTTRRFGGTGLGLAICSMLVELMGGRISVRSEFQKGSVFSVRLPFAVPTAEGTEADAPPLIALNCRIIGAEQPLSNDLTTYLATSGAQVQRFDDLRAAAAAEQPPGPWSWLILPDQLVPDLDTLQAMPRSANSEETRFVVLTRGKRHRPRLEAANLMSVDANALYRRALLDALAPAHPLAEEDLSKPASVSMLAVARAPSREEAIEQGRLILVAEDNETNRKVIMRQMPLIGFACEIVESGRQALACWRTGDFALLLTDLHMPEMDGYDLATVIRNEEGGSRRLPIIALTANVLREEELRCKAAGMDSYLTKPVRLPLLKAELEKFLGPVPTARIFPTTKLPLLHAVVDLSVLKALVGDDPVVIAEIVQAFRRSALLARTALRAHVLNGEAQSLSGAAHTFKSVARSVGAQRLGDVCAQLEHVAQVEKEGSLSELLEEFEFELDAVMHFLDVN
jgi:two-component system, sensor histidine kinase and response regulator